MTGRNNRPDPNGQIGHPSQLDQYREEFSEDLETRSADQGAHDDEDTGSQPNQC